MDDWIEVIAKAQAPDGYISTQIQLTDVQRWQEVKYHKLYNMGHLLTAAYVHHRATGKDNFLSNARKLGDYLCETLLLLPRELAHFGFNPSNIMGAAELYRTAKFNRQVQQGQYTVTSSGHPCGRASRLKSHTGA